MTAHDARAQLIADLYAFADLLELRTDMPVDDRTITTIQHTVTGPTDAARIAEVERIAARLGVDVDRSPRHASALLRCGRVEYVVYANTDAGEAQWAAAVSCAGAVEPGLVTR